MPREFDDSHARVKSDINPNPKDYGKTCDARARENTASESNGPYELTTFTTYLVLTKHKITSVARGVMRLTLNPTSECESRHVTKSI